MNVTAVICSVGRPDDLAISLEHLANQTREPRQVVVVAQLTDVATQEVATSIGAEVCIVDKPGLAFAVESAVAQVGAGICAFVDDDARAHPDWIERLQRAFEDDRVGAVGGRDNVGGDSTSGSSSLTVGRVTRSGRIIGNHHLGKGSARPVDTVKGANMAIRVDAARGFELSKFVVGEGAQYRNELILTAEVRRRGYRVVYDPNIQVDHFPASRALGDDRQLFTRERITLNVANELTALRISESRSTRSAYTVRAVVVGTRLHPGLARVARDAVHGDLSTLSRFRGVMRGLRQAWSPADLAAESWSTSVHTVPTRR